MVDYAVPKPPVFRKTPKRTPDYNPDKERHVDHTFVVQKADRSPGNTLKVGDTEVKLNKEGRAFIKDEALARELQIENRFNATVTRVRTPKASDAGHRYHFGQMPEMPWKKKKEEDGKGQEQNRQESAQADPAGRVRPGSGDNDSCNTKGSQREAA